MQKNSPDMARQVFRDSFPCPYFTDGRIAALEYVLSSDLGLDEYGTLLAGGFRRSGIVFYRNSCEHCSDCLPIRIDTNRFTPSRSQKRTHGRNRDIQMSVAGTPSLSREKIQLYTRYQRSRHSRGDAENAGEALDALAALHHGYSGIIEMDYFLGDRLIAVGLVDAAENALSANYFYYDTDHAPRRLGIYSILQEIALARSLGRQYYYLGFYIEGTPKMSYKKFFRPNQAFRDSVWSAFLE